MRWSPVPETYSRLPVLPSSSYCCFIRQVDITSAQQVKCEVKTFQELLCGSNPSNPCERKFAISFQGEVANLVMV